MLNRNPVKIKPSPGELYPDWEGLIPPISYTRPFEEANLCHMLDWEVDVIPRDGLKELVDEFIKSHSSGMGLAPNSLG